MVGVTIVPRMTTEMDRVEDLIAECAAYEERLTSKLADARQNAPDRVTPLARND
jgi:hypothetical protein